MNELHVPDDVARACLQALSAPLGTVCLCDRPDAAALLDMGGQAVLVVDALGRILYFNALAEALTGRRAADVVGRRCTDALGCDACSVAAGAEGPVGGDCATGGRCALACSRHYGGILCSRVVTLGAKDGRPLRLLKEARRLLGPDGAVVGAFETLHPLGEDMVSDHREVARLESDCTLLESLTGAIDEGLVAVTREGAVACLNARAACMLGATSAVRGGPVRALLREPARVLEALEAAFERGAERTIAGVMPVGRAAAVDVRVIALPGPDGRTLGAALRLQLSGAPLGTGAHHGMICASQVMRRLASTLESLAVCDATILLTGESGVGKEVVARALHAAGPRAKRPFYAVNCAGLTAELLESELFGHERGAFTGAVRDKPGRLELCEDGTLLLDEVGCLPLALQAKLLRVLEGREFERVGGTRSLRLRARIVAATNADLESLVQRGAFRCDLYYRLNVVPLVVPPLRTRPEDILPLARHFAAQLEARDDVRFTDDARTALLGYGWPGNVRELRNAIQFAFAMGAEATIDASDLPVAVLRGRASKLEPPTSERRTIEHALERAANNRVEAADLLGISRTTLWRRMRQLDIA